MAHHDLRHVHSVSCMMRFTALLTALLASPLLLLSADFHDYVPLGQSKVQAFLPTETRTVIDLSGSWQRVEDGEIVGNVQVPGVISTDGPVTLRKTVKIDEHTLKARAWQLLFLGVSDEVRLKVNNRELVRHPGGTSPFTALISDRMLVSGSNVIELTIGPGGALSALARRFAPAAPKVWRGITRELFLVGTPQVWTADVHTSTAFSSGFTSASVVATATIRGANVDRLLGLDGAESLRQGSVDVAIEAVLRVAQTDEIVSRSSVQTLQVERSRTVQCNMDLYVPSPRLWTPSTPNLYELEVRCTHNGRLIDSYRMDVGLRSVRIATYNKQRWVMLNNQPLFLYGINYVDEYPKVGPALSWRQMEYDVSLLKTLGTNVIRVVHGAPHPYLLSLCDRYGIMVMAEVDAASIPSGLLEEEEIAAQLRNRADLLATYVGSHPSLLACGLSEGLEEAHPATLQFHQSLSKILRSRVSAPLYKVVTGSQASNISEGGFDVVILDLTSSHDRSRIGTVLKDASTAVRSAALLTMVGSMISPSNSNGFSDPLSLESQAVYIREGLQATRSSGLAGCIVSSFSDYTLDQPTMLVDHHNEYMHTSGLVDEWRQPRLAYEMYKSLINDEKEPLLQARNYNDGTPLIFVITGITLALFLTLLINRSRRFREYFLRSIVRPYNFYADIRDQRILSTPQTVMLGVVIAIGAGLVIAAMVYYLRTDPRMEYLLHILIPGDGLYMLLRSIAWQPTLAVGVFGALLFTSFVAAAGLLRIGGMFVKGKIFYRDTLTIVVWSCVPLLALLPIGVALYQILATDALSFWIPAITFLAIAWTLLRTLRATSVVFDVPGLIVYGIGLGFIVLVVGIMAVIWGVRYDALDFLAYYQNVVAG